MGSCTVIASLAYMGVRPLGIVVSLRLINPLAISPFGAYCPSD